MKIQLLSGKHNKHDCLLVAVTKNWGFLNQSLDTSEQQAIAGFLKNGLLEETEGATLFIPALPGLNEQSILLFYCDKGFNKEHYLKFLSKAYYTLKQYRITRCLSYLHELEVTGANAAWTLKANTTVIGDVFYEFDTFKTIKKSKTTVKEINFPNVESKLKSDLTHALALNKAFTLCKDLANTPSNVCTPTYIANAAKKLSAKHPKLKVTVLGEAMLRKMGMNTLLAVGEGSAVETKLITLEYKGGKTSDKPYVFIGKGITFDTGGYSLKPAASMLQMHYDMCGAATVIALIQYLIDTKMPINVTGIIPSAENMVDALAFKPNDIIKSYSGQTIEITNTDAEGRLILCDALTYAERFDPQAVITLATLTGGVLVALGHTASGVMGYDQTLVNELVRAGEESGDRCWQLPLYEDFDEMLKSKVADMQNAPGRLAQSSTAACFLGRFAKKFAWAHLDIAGTAHTDKKLATGRPLSLLAQFIEHKVKSA